MFVQAQCQLTPEAEAELTELRKALAKDEKLLAKVSAERQFICRKTYRLLWLLLLLFFFFFVHGIERFGGGYCCAAQWRCCPVNEQHPPLLTYPVRL